jgi:hypothetical protein
VELGGHVAQLNSAAAHRGEQLLDVFARQRAQLDAALRRGGQICCDWVEFTHPVRTHDQHVAQRYRQKFGQQQE